MKVLQCWGKTSVFYLNQSCLNVEIEDQVFSYIKISISPSFFGGNRKHSLLNTRTVMRYDLIQLERKQKNLMLFDVHTG